MSFLSSADHVNPFGLTRNGTTIFGFPSGSGKEYSAASSSLRKHPYARYLPLWENAGRASVTHIGLTGIRLVSNVSVERRYIFVCSSDGNRSAKAIHLPSGDQLIIANSCKGIRVERNFLSVPPRAGRT